MVAVWVWILSCFNGGRMAVLKKTIIKTKKLKSIRVQCDELWAQAVKLRAGNKSQLSGKTENLNAHHIVGKPNLRLRHELNNGICLTAGEHIFGIHNEGRRELYMQKIEKIIGTETIKQLRELKFSGSKTDLHAVRTYLINEIKKLKEGETQ
jgi:hypothetical protein